METEERLITETEKWLTKLEALEISALTDKGKDFKTNIEAYISDTRHFLEQKDYVRAFEACVWAWAWCEIGKEIDILRY